MADSVVKVIFKGIDQLSNTTKNVNSEMSGLIKNIVSIGTVSTAIVSVGKYLYSAEQAANESNIAMSKQEAILRATGYAANTTAEELANYTDKLSKLNGVDDEAIANAESMLLTFRNIGREEFPRAAQAAIDLSTTFGDLNSSSMQLGKALNDPIQGVTALQRVGVTFTEQQKEMIDNFVEMGDVAGAQNIILSEIENQVGGTAAAIEAASDGSKRLEISSGNLSEAIGNSVVPAAREWNNLLADIFDNLTETIEAQNDYTDSLETLARQTGMTSSEVYAIQHGYKSLTQEQKDAIKQNEFMEDRLSAIDAEMRDLGFTLDETTGKWGRNTNAIELDNEALTKANNQILDYADQFSGAMNLTAEEHDKATKKIILGYMNQKLAADGILTDDETRWLLEKGVEWGIYSATAIEEMQKAMSEADKLTSSLNSIPSQKNIHISITASTKLAASMASDQAMYEEMNAVMGDLYSSGGRASEGIIMPGRAYGVSEDEVIIPNTTSTVVAADKLGGNVTNVFNVSISTFVPPNNQRELEQLVKPAFDNLYRQQYALRS